MQDNLGAEPLGHVRVSAVNQPSLGTNDSETWPDPRELAGIDILRDLTAEQRALVGSRGKEVTLPPGYILGTHGSQGDAIYLILEGNVELSHPTPLGYLAVRIVKGGESVPLSILLGQGRFITTAVTIDSSRVLVIPRASLLALCNERPDIGMVIFRAVAEILGSRYAATLSRLAETLDKGLQRAELWANV